MFLLNYTQCEDDRGDSEYYGPMWFSTDASFSPDQNSAQPFETREEAEVALNANLDCAYCTWEIVESV